MNRLIGAHVSASGGADKAAKRAAEMGCNAVQIFTSSPRVWKGRVVEQVEADKYQKACEQYRVKAGVIHAMYLINLASDKPESVKKSQQAIIEDLTAANTLGMIGVVVHIGSHQKRGFDTVKDQLVSAISEVIEKSGGNSIFLIENAASPNKIGGPMQEIEYLIKTVKSPRLGWCLDTCHAHAAGDPLSTLVSQVSVLDKAEECGILDSLQCIHVNDSKDAFGSFRDRHENLGEGQIDHSSFQAFVNDPRITHLPLILEVPGFDNNGPDAKNVVILKSWLR